MLCEVEKINDIYSYLLPVGEGGLVILTFSLKFQLSSGVGKSHFSDVLVAD